MTFSSEHADAFAVSHRRRTIGYVGTIPESLSEWLPYFTRREYIERTGTTPDGRRVLSHEAAMIHRDRVLFLGLGLGRVVRQSLRENWNRQRGRDLVTVDLDQITVHTPFSASTPEQVSVGSTGPPEPPEPQADQYVHSLTHAANAPGIAA